MTPILTAAFCLLSRFGSLVHTSRFVELCRYAKWKARLKYLGENVVFYGGVVIHGPQEVSIGKGTRIADYVHMWGSGGIEIGENVLIAAHSVITSMTHDPDVSPYAGSLVKRKVILEDNVWLGSNCVILPGVTIGANAIVAAGAVVTKGVAPGDIVGGVPARSIKATKSPLPESARQLQRDEAGEI
jgi:maltose O-acetyltransferase